MTNQLPLVSLRAAATPVLLCLVMFVASIPAAASDPNPQPPSDGDLPNTLDAKEAVTLLAVSLWAFVQVPVALLMRMDANGRGANGNPWLVLGAFPLLGYGTWPLFLWIRSNRPQERTLGAQDDMVRHKVPSRTHERDRSGM